MVSTSRKSFIKISSPTESGQSAPIILPTSVGLQTGCREARYVKHVTVMLKPRTSSSGAPPQALHSLQEGPLGLVLLQGGAVLLLLLDDATLYAAKAGFTLSSPADTSCGQRLGELLHHQWQQMGRECVHAGRHGERWPKCEDNERREWNSRVNSPWDIGFRSFC